MKLSSVICQKHYENKILMIQDQNMCYLLKQTGHSGFDRVHASIMLSHFVSNLSKAKQLTQVFLKKQVKINQPTIQQIRHPRFNGLHTSAAPSHFTLNLPKAKQPIQLLKKRQEKINQLFIQQIRHLEFNRLHTSIALLQIGRAHV